MESIEEEKHPVIEDIEEVQETLTVRNRLEYLDRWVGYNPKSLFFKPDIFDIFSFLLIILFFIAIFVNITFLGSSDPILYDFAIKCMAIVSLGLSGIVLKMLSDFVRLKNSDGTASNITLTVTVFEFPIPSALYPRKKGEKVKVKPELTSFGKGIVYTFVGFVIALAGNVVISLILGSFRLSFLDMTMELFVVSVISSVSEELFFSYGLESVTLSLVNFLSFPIVCGVFLFYHLVVYSTFITGLFYILLSRIVYSIVYFVTRRFSSVTLAHLMNNMLSFSIGGF